MNTPGPGSYAPNYEDRTYIEYTNPNPFDKTQVKFEQKNIPNVYATPADEIAAIRKANTPLQTLPYSINGQSHRYVNLPGGGQKLVQTAPGGDPYTSANAPKPTLPGTTQHLNAVNSFVSKQDDYSYTTPFTVGDALQAAEVASKFGMLGSPEVETPNLDSTSITKNVYDVRPQIYQSQRSFNQVKHGIGSATNLNTRRALLSSAYANKLNTDSQIIDRYHNLNNEANTQYEQRLADQRRYNIQQQNYTNDINARNRGQHYTLLDNAWSSLGNFGEQLNNKVFANDAMALYEEMFPEVYKDNAKALDRNRSLKLGRRRYGK